MVFLCLNTASASLFCEPKLTSWEGEDTLLDDLISFIHPHVREKSAMRCQK